MYLSYDSFSYFASKFSWLLPLGTVRSLIHTVFSNFENNEAKRSNIKRNSIKCVNCNKIICGKHKKSGCEECLLNSELVFLT